jgi:hypothetical protein
LRLWFQRLGSDLDLYLGNSFNVWFGNNQFKFLSDSVRNDRRNGFLNLNLWLGCSGTTNSCSSEPQ